MCHLSTQKGCATLRCQCIGCCALYPQIFLMSSLAVVRATARLPKRMSLVPEGYVRKIRAAEGRPTSDNLGTGRDLAGGRHPSTGADAVTLGNATSRSRPPCLFGAQERTRTSRWRRTGPGFAPGSSLEQYSDAALTSKHRWPPTTSRFGGARGGMVATKRLYLSYPVLPCKGCGDHCPVNFFLPRSRTAASSV